MSVTVLNPGILTTVQDRGRIGYQQFGVPVSGAMDQRATAIANILAGNDDVEAVLECTFMGPHLRFDAANVIAVTGGDLGPTIDGHPIPMYAAVRVEAGQVLRFTGPRTGCRAYIAFAGGLDIPAVMGSRSTYMKAKIGGLSGRKLMKDDVIGFRAPNPALSTEKRRVPPECVQLLEYNVRVVMGPQDDMFTDEGIETFLSNIYTVTPEFDRMGCRLEGPIIRHKDGGDIISDGIAFGAVQVPTAGKPIVMLADRQTTGGYAKIANVITADFSILAQLKAGDKLRFTKVSIADAQMAFIYQRRMLNALRADMQ